MKRIARSRREVLVIAGALITGLVGGLLIHLATRANWSWSGWVGVSAVGQLGAAVATVATLIFFFWQRQRDQLRAADPQVWLQFECSKGSPIDGPRLGTMTIHVANAVVCYQTKLHFVSRAKDYPSTCVTLKPDQYDAVVGPSAQKVGMTWVVPNKAVEGRMNLTFYNAINRKRHWSQRITLPKGTDDWLGIANAPTISDELS